MVCGKPGLFSGTCRTGNTSTRHCLDVMHVTKNICESPLATIVNMPDRTKDGSKARHDLELLGIKKKLHGPPDNDDETMDEGSPQEG
jgi:hypothetical protein